MSRYQFVLEIIGIAWQWYKEASEDGVITNKERIDLADRIVTKAKEAMDDH